MCRGPGCPEAAEKRSGKGLGNEHGKPLAAAVGAALSDPHPFAARAAAGQAHLRLLETTDLHAHVHPYDYYADRPMETAGLARTASLIAIARAEAGNVLVFDNGDFLQGNPMGDYAALERGQVPHAPHPMIAAMNAVGYDAATIGNHDFNYGLDFLTGALAGAAFPVVSANVATRLGADPLADRLLLPPYVILDRMLACGDGSRAPIRVGVLGFLPPQIATWDRRHLEGRAAPRDIVEAAEAWVPAMRAAGADLVVALAHSGIGAARHEKGMENACVPLAGLPGIDAILCGHSHQVFPSTSFAGLEAVDVAAGTLAGKPAVMAGFWGSHLGLIDLLLERGGETGWRLIAHESTTRPIATHGRDRALRAVAPSAAAVLDSVAADHAATLRYARRPVGHTSVPLNSYFSLVADDPSVRIVAEAQRWYLAEMLSGGLYGDLPILSAAAPFKSGGRGGPEHYTDMPAGPLAIRNIADLYLYPNTIRALLLTGAEVKDWLDRAAGAFLRIEPGRPDQPLIDPDFACYNFDLIAGLRYRIDPSQPSRFDAAGGLADPGASRIVELTHAGKPVDPAARFVLATNNYRAGGGGGFPGARAEKLIFEGPDSNRDILLRHIVETGCPIMPAPGEGWRFVPLPGTSVLYDTGPGAARHLAGLPLRIEPLGEAPDGFARFRIAL